MPSGRNVCTPPLSVQILLAPTPSSVPRPSQQAFPGSLLRATQSEAFPLPTQHPAPASTSTLSHILSELSNPRRPVYAPQEQVWIDQEREGCSTSTARGCPSWPLCASLLGVAMTRLSPGRVLPGLVPHVSGIIGHLLQRLALAPRHAGGTRLRCRVAAVHPFRCSGGIPLYEYTSVYSFHS